MAKVMNSAVRMRKSMVVTLVILLSALILSGGSLLSAQLGQTPGEEAWNYIKDIRTLAGVPTVRRNSELHQAAQRHAQYCAVEGLLTHDETNTANPHYRGPTPRDRATAAGYPPQNLSTGEYSVAENGAAGRGLTSKAAVDMWLAGVYHRWIIIHPDVKEMGWGQAEGNDNVYAFLDVGFGAYTAPAGLLPIPWSKGCAFKVSSGDSESSTPRGRYRSGLSYHSQLAAIFYGNHRGAPFEERNNGRTCGLFLEARRDRSLHVELLCDDSCRSAPSRNAVRGVCERACGSQAPA